jgi:hypothetical protein
MANEVEYGEAVAISDNRFPVDQERLGWQGRDCRNNDREATEKSLPWRVMSFSSGHDAEAVMLNFVQPARPGWRALGRGRQTRFDNA